MRAILDLAEGVLGGTPLEPWARFVWSEISGIGNPRARQSARYDWQTIRIMRRVLKVSSTCVEAGAHRGSMLRWMRKLAPEGRHFAFEPLPELARHLREEFPDVHVYEAALSDVAGESLYCHVIDHPGLSGFRRMGNVPPGARIEEIIVESRRLDDLFRDGPQVTFMKVDVEGAQLQVFRGAVQTITRFKPYVIFEHGMLAKEAYGTTSEAIHEVLADQCGLQISLLSDWLDEKPPLTREAFDRHVGYHSGSHFCFLAHP